MSRVLACPDRELLQRLLLGLLPGSEGEQLAQHLEQCSHCTVLARSIQAEDTLVEAARARAAAEPESQAVRSLIERLREQLPKVSDPDSNAATSASPSGVERSAQATPPPSPPASLGGSTEELYDFLAPPEGPGEIGRLGPYRIVKVLGAGGMGIVFLAEDPQLQRPVALKAMKPALAASASARKRFLREARAVAALSHDHIVSIHQVGEDRGVPFLIMPLLQGETLAERLQREGKLPAAEVLRIGREAAEGLAAAHERGLIHRDIKPANLWLEAGTGRVKLLDFGLARAVADEGGLSHLGTVLGTPAYMAPEQAHGESADPRADLFSLGCVLYQLCTGQVPFQGSDTMSTLAALASDQPRPPCELNPEVAPALSDQVMQLLARDPEDRPLSARAVAEALQRQATGAGALPARSPGRRRLRWALAAAVLLLAGGGLLVPQIIRIFDKQGKLVGEHKVPEGGTYKEGPSGPAPPPDPVKDKPSEPLSPLALVSRPARLEGVQGWTIETRLPRGNIRALAYSADGKLLAVLSEWDSAIRIYEVQTGQLVRALVGHGGPAHLARWHMHGALAWSPDGTTLAHGGDGAVRLWDADTWKLLQVLKGHEGEVTAVAWSPNREKLASVGGCKTVWLWDARTGRRLHMLPAQGEVSGHTAWVTSLAWSPDGETLASGSMDYTVRLWETTTGKHLRALQHANMVDAVAWSSDGKTLASACRDRTTRLWEASTGKPLHTIAHKEPVNALALSPDGKTLACGGHYFAGLWDAAAGKQRRAFPGTNYTITAVAWSPDGKTLAYGADLGVVQVWEPEGDKSLVALGLPHDLGRVLSKAAWSADGKTLATGTYLTFWDAERGQLSWSSGHSASALAFAPDSRTLATGAADATVHLREVATRTELWQAKGHEGEVFVVAYSSDGKVLATGGNDLKVWLWDAASGKPLRSIEVQIRPVYTLAWSPDGKTLASMGPAQVQFWDADSCQLQRNFNPGGAGSALAWSPDGKTLACGTFGGSVHLLESRTGKRLKTFKGHQGRIWDLTWLADGKQLISVSEDTTVRTWDVDTGEMLRTLEGLSRFGGFSPDLRLLVCRDVQGGVLRLLETETGAPRGVIVLLRGFPSARYVAIQPDGHYRGSRDVERELVYVVQTEKGQETLSPVEFAAKYGWKNDPGRVRLTGK